jgi:hypothetical protein
LLLAHHGGHGSHGMLIAHHHKKASCRMISSPCPEPGAQHPCQSVPMLSSVSVLCGAVLCSALRCDVRPAIQL